MELNQLLGTVMSEDSIKNIARTAGVSEEKTRNILGMALPEMLSGALNQAKNSGTAEGFAGALRQHGQADTADLGSFLSHVDLADGAKIVEHLLGSGDGVEQISKKAKAGKKDVSSVLSAVAPLLMSLLGQQTQGSQSGSAVAGLMGSLLQNVDVGSLLTGLLGGGKTGRKTDGKSDGLLGALTGLLK